MPKIYIPVKNKNKRTDSASKLSKSRLWADSKKMEVVNLYLEHGNMRTVSKITGISYSTLCKWVYSDWWKEIIKGITEGEAVAVNTGYRKITKKAVEQINDRLETGDYILDSKTGEVKNIPLKAKDLSRIAKESIAAQKELDTIINKQETAKETIELRLIKLAEQFSNFVKDKHKHEQIIDAEIVYTTSDDPELHKELGIKEVI